MYRQLPVFAALVGFITLPVSAQTPSQTVPIYQVTVTERTVKAINYQYKSGPTQIDFRGTVLLPESKGEAVVESKSGRTQIDLHIDHLPAPSRFGGEYLTYVLWAITPEGHPKNLGELVANSSDKAHVQVTTDLQAFGLIVTAEPYAAVRQPSDVVVAENQVRPDTIGQTEPIQVRYELMPRHGYTYNMPADRTAEGNGPKVSMGEYETTLEVYQAMNAVQIAQAAGAEQYAPDVMKKAESELRNAQALQAQKVDKSLVIAAAREASQTAEDARILAAQRAKDAELAKAQAAVAQERQLRLQAQEQAREARDQASQARDQAAQAQALASQAQAAQQQAQAVAARASADRAQPAAAQQSDAQQAAAQQPAPPTPPPALNVVVTPETIPPPPPLNGQTPRELRVSLLQQMNQYFPTLDTPQGLVTTIPDTSFHASALEPVLIARVDRVAALVAAHPGLTVEVDGFTDSASPEAERVAAARAASVREALAAAGLAFNLIAVKSLGNSRPVGSNATAQGREMNRRIEIVVSGAPIGNLASWDKSYSVIRK